MKFDIYLKDGISAVREKNIFNLENHNLKSK